MRRCSKWDSPDLQEVHHNDRSCAVVSLVAESVLHSCRFFFNASLYRLTGRPHGLLLDSGGKLAVEDSLSKSCVRHVNQMARPAKLCLYKHGFNFSHLAVL